MAAEDQVGVLLMFEGLQAPTEAELAQGLLALGLRAKAGEAVWGTSRVEEIRDTLRAGLLAFLLQQAGGIPAAAIHGFVLPRMPWLEAVE